MNKGDEEQLTFLYEQWRWLQEQDLLLAKIEGKLRAMRALAQHRLDNLLNDWQIHNLQCELQQLQLEVNRLEQELHQGMKN